MSAPPLPEWLRRALPASGSVAPTPHGGEVRPGVVCLISAADVPPRQSEARLVLVLELDPVSGLASVMLTHTDYEIRTSRDVLITHEEMGLPFDLAMETDIVGPIPAAALDGGVVGSVGGATLEALLDAVETGEMPELLRSRVGIPLRGESDGRWGWKLAEGEALDRLLTVHVVQPAEAMSPIRLLAEALSATGGCRNEGRDELDGVTECLIAYAARREAPPMPVLALLAQPATRAALGNDRFRAISTILRAA